MIDLGNRHILDDGTVICSESAAVDILYQGRDLSDVVLDDEQITTAFNKANDMLDQGFEKLISSDRGIFNECDWYSAWLTPEPWVNIDVEAYCLKKCDTDQQRDRVRYEMVLFADRKMIPVLRHLIWMVDYLRDRKIFWGVGRGSSVSSYILYLIGINRIDPLKFDLDVKEFLK